MRIAFLGLGQMGAPMAERLLQSGFSLSVFDPSPERVALLKAAGASAGTSPRDAAKGCDIVFACLPSPEVSLVVAIGPEGVLSGARPSVYVEMSTIGSAAVQEIATAADELGSFVLDAPVSGGPRGARAGTLTTMVAGSNHAFGIAREALDTIAGNVFHVGDTPGQGQVAKLVNNMISATAMAVSFEATTMGVKAGIDPDTLIDLINASTGRTGATLDKFPASILTGTFDYGGKLATMYKDVMLCLEEYRARGIPYHVSSSAAQMWFHGMAEGRGDDDYTSLIRINEAWAGVEVRGKAARDTPEPGGTKGGGNV